MLTEAKAAVAAASLATKLIVLGVLALAIGFVVWKGYDAIYDRGVAACQDDQKEAQDRADAQQAAREATQEAGAKATGDKARATGKEQREAAATAATKTSEAIQREYQSKPAKAASCTPDGRPAPVPERVQEELREAKRSAEAAGS